MKAPEKQKNSRTDYINDKTSFTIKRATRFASGNIGFDIEINGITIYGCVFVYSEGRQKWFTSFPSRKGTDGKYYNYVFVPFSDADNAKIENEIEKALQ